MNCNKKVKYIDFASLLNDIEIKEATEKNKKVIFRNTIIEVEKNNAVLYAVMVVIAVILIIPYFFCNNEECPKIVSIFMSVGTSLLGAVALAYFIEKNNYVTNYRKRIGEYNNNLIYLYDTLWVVFASGSYKILNANNSGCVVLARQIANNFIIHYNTSISTIDRIILNYPDMIDDSNGRFYQMLKEQLAKFVSDLQNPISPNHLIELLDGTKEWLEKNITDKQIKKLLFIYEPGPSWLYRCWLNMKKIFEKKIIPVSLLPIFGIVFMITLFCLGTIWVPKNILYRAKKLLKDKRNSKNFFRY